MRLAPPRDSLMPGFVTMETAGLDTRRRARRRSPSLALGDWLSGHVPGTRTDTPYPGD